MLSRYTQNGYIGVGQPRSGSGLRPVSGPIIVFDIRPISGIQNIHNREALAAMTKTRQVRFPRIPFT